MWLILTEPFDPTGAWLSEGLTARSGQLFSHFTSHDIDRDARCERGGPTGQEWFRLHTRNGAVIDSRTVRGVVNLLFSMPPGLSNRINPADRGAAIRNFTTPFMRWLHYCPGPVINRPNAQGICGDIRLPAEWVSAAESVGLPCLASETHWSRHSWFARPEHSGELPPTQHVLVIGESLVPLTTPGVTLPTHIATACSRLAHVAHAPLLGIDLIRLPADRWCFLAAYRRPDLRAGGAAAIEAIARALGLDRPGRVPRQPTAEPAQRLQSAGDLISAFSLFHGMAAHTRIA